MGTLTRGAPPRARGFTLLIVLVALTMLLFGALIVMRGMFVQVATLGNIAQHQRDVQSGDLALRQAEQAVIQTAQSGGDIPLELSASSKSWFYVPGTSPWAPPGASGGANAGFWSTCQGNGTCDTLADMVSTVSPAPSALPGGANALVVVVPTNLPTDAYSCGNTGFTATYYDIFLHITEASGVTSANTETVFKLCTPSS